MADSWGFIIIIFFVAAVIVFIIKLFVEYPGLLQLACIYKEDNKREQKLEKFQRTGKDIEKIGQSDELEHLGKNTESKEKLEARIKYLEEKLKKKDKKIKNLKSRITLSEGGKNKKTGIRFHKGILKRQTLNEDIHENENSEEYEEEVVNNIQNDQNTDILNGATSIQCKELKLLNSKIHFV